MKNLTILLAGTLLALTATACRQQAPQQDGMSVHQALAERHSVRSYSDQPVSETTVLDILWAANGINREDGRRTAPSAINAQDILLYVCNAEGAFKYDPQGRKLVKISSYDLRPDIKAHNRFIEVTPLVILLVTDQEKFGEPRPDNHFMNMGYIDAGIVSENISLYCTAIGLGTVCCAPMMPVEKVQQTLGLGSRQIPILYHPIGYAAEQGL